MERYSEFAERFNQMLDRYAGNKSQVELAEELNTSQSMISRVKKGTKLPTESMVDAIMEQWGEDIRDAVERARGKSDIGSFRERLEQAQMEAIRKKLEKAKEADSGKGVPYYDTDFIGGFNGAEQGLISKPTALISVVGYERATCWCNVTGHSMEPEICNGDIIALREVKDWRFLPYGRIYAIVTYNGFRAVKRIGKSEDPDCYKLISTNQSEEYAPQDIRKDDIVRIFEVMGCIKNF